MFSCWTRLENNRGMHPTQQMKFFFFFKCTKSELLLSVCIDQSEFSKGVTETARLGVYKCWEMISLPFIQIKPTRIVYFLCIFSKYYIIDWTYFFSNFCVWDGTSQFISFYGAMQKSFFCFIFIMGPTIWGPLYCFQSLFFSVEYNSLTITPV